MAPITRRSLIRAAGYLGALAPFSALSEFASAATKLPPAKLPAGPEARALVVTRLLNTLQSRSKVFLESYLQLEALLAAEFAKPLLDGAGLSMGDAAGGRAEISGCNVSTTIGPGGGSYEVLVTDPIAAVVYQSDEKGVIRKGTMHEGVFVGQPIFAPKSKERMGWFAAIAQFISPTLHASPGPYCCNLYGFGCHWGACPGPPGTGHCSLYCCNLGYGDCPWCCSTGTDCAYILACTS